MTFSTRKSVFPKQLMRQDEGKFITGKKLKSEIIRAGFSINENKTRIQYKDSRQDVTGLIVNKKLNVKKEYWRTVRSQCHSLFRTGTFTKKNTIGEIVGNINELEGQLNFIDQVELFNRLRPKAPLNPIRVEKKLGNDKTLIFSGREKTLSKFLYYRLFYANTKPTILVEGDTDNIYLKSAISMLAKSYSTLARAKTKDSDYELLIRTVQHTKRTKFLLGLHGSSSYLCNFIRRFENHYKFYKAPKPKCPVIIVLDNDLGFDDFPSILANNKSLVHPATLKSSDYRNAEFIHVMHNLYIVLTPLNPKGEHTDIEYLFDDTARLKQHNGRCFNTVGKRDDKKDLSKVSFADHIVKSQKGSTNFNGLKPLLDRITSAINHYNSIK